MPRNSAPTKATGGGGYTFADKVATAFLAQMLKRAFPVEPEFGPIAELHFEARDTGQILDDLWLVLKRGTEATRCAISVKSNRLLTRAGFNGEFVGDAREQWNSAGFNKETDLLGLIVGVIDAPTLEEWRELQKQDFAATPPRMVQRLADSQQSSAIQRALFESLSREQNGVSPDPVETARLASRIRVLPFLEGDEGRYMNLCAEIVLDGSVEEGTKLWSRLLQLAAENRATGGFFNLAKLVRVLRPDFELRDYADFEADWKRIEAVSQENLNNVRTLLGADIHLPRTEELNGVSRTVAARNVVVIAGESGSGKSSLVSQLVAGGGTFKRILWLTAEQLSKSSQACTHQCHGKREATSRCIHGSRLGHEGSLRRFQRAHRGKCRGTGLQDMHRTECRATRREFVASVHLVSSSFSGNELGSEHKTIIPACQVNDCSAKLPAHHTRFDRALSLGSISHIQ
jgi:hypothetical protein